MFETKLSIINDALNYLGSEPINSLEDDSKQARVMGRQYKIAKEFILKSHGWNFALKRVKLTKTVDTPVFGDANLFLLPTDYVRYEAVLDEGYDKLRKWKVEGREILCFEDQLYLIYVTNDPIDGYMDPMFKKALAAQLAADSCYSITNSTSLMQGLYSLAENFVGKAKTNNSQEGTPKDFTWKYFDDARVSTHEIYANSDEF